jgi:hypothetical protein
MASLRVHPDRLEIHLTPAEKTLAFRRENLVIARDTIRSVTITDDPWIWVRGIRAPGALVPLVLAIGVWKFHGGKDFLAIKRRRQAVVIDLTGDDFARVILSTNHAPDLIASLKLDADEPVEVSNLDAPAEIPAAAVPAKPKRVRAAKPAKPAKPAEPATPDDLATETAATAATDAAKPATPVKRVRAPKVVKPAAVKPDAVKPAAAKPAAVKPAATESAATEPAHADGPADGTEAAPAPKPKRVRAPKPAAPAEPATPADAPEADKPADKPTD